MGLRNYSIKTINQFLDDRYHIPNYQRDYSWEENELEDFWDDLEDTRNDIDNDVHFFGQIVVHSADDEKRKYIIDGQQRTITSTIFLRVIYTIVENIYKETESSNMIDDECSDALDVVHDIRSKNIGRYKIGADKLHLVLGDLDKDYFRESIQLNEPDPKIKLNRKSQIRLRNAYYFFKDKFVGNNGLLKSVDKDRWFDIVNSYYETFVDRFQVLYLEATELNEAFVIFETLNARGVDLEMADLLKNYIFSKSKDVSIAQKEWNNMINNLDQVDPTRFIRHYWNSRNRFTREKDLYRKISKTVKTPRASNEILFDLVKYSSSYHDISVPQESSHFTNDELIDSLISLNNLGAKTFYPVILAMEEAEIPFEEKDIAKVCNMIETFVFRNFVICSKVANSAEVLFANIAQDIFDGNLASVEGINDVIRKEIVSDEEFKESFKIWSSKKKTVIRYILTKIHNYLCPTQEINMNNSIVHIEHIMPQNNKIWKVPDDIHEDYLWRLGNLALLDGKKNTKGSNKEFQTKKEIYIKSQIYPNHEIADNEKWSMAEIEDRQAKFAEMAVNIWGK